MSPILASCVIANVCKLIRNTKSLVTGVQGPGRTDTTRPVAIAQDLRGKTYQRETGKGNPQAVLVYFHMLHFDQCNYITINFVTGS